MVTEYLTEQEQIDQLKKWLRIYGLPTILGIVIGIVIIYSWQYYQNYRLITLEKASIIYDTMLSNYLHNNTTAANDNALDLLHDYPKTTYADLAQLILAKIAILNHNYPGAIERLMHVLNTTKQAEIRQISRLRLARIYIAQQQASTAIQLLTIVDSPSFNGLINEVRGDAYVTLKDAAAAKLAYQQALANLPQAVEIRPLLQLKLDNLL
jgi:predicted negative regulator of RcsB-dependent stress response